jgi:hypothetical protein
MNTKSNVAATAANTSAAAQSGNDQNTGTDNAGEQAKPDPFANLPLVRLNDVEVVDMTEVATSDPRKYAKVQEAAAAARMPTKAGWKHSAAMFVPGSLTKEFRGGSVFGTVVDLVKKAGRTGIASYELATQLRQAQLGNKRSHYCTALPPVGWAEGYIDSAVTQGLIGTHATKKAPALVAPPAPAAPAEGEGKAANA